jgi:hypothetical protein
MKMGFKDGLPGYLTAKGECITFKHGDLAGELEAFNAAKATFLQGHYGTSEGAVAGWDVRGRGKKEEEKKSPDTKVAPQPKEEKKSIDPGNDLFQGKLNVGSATAKDFVEARDKLPTELRAFLTPYTPEQYEKDGVKLYLDKSGKGGFGLRGDEGISIFSAPGAHMGSKLMDESIKLGMKKLDCIGNKLLKFYAKKGFKVTKIDKWDDKYKPDGWDTAKFGRPNIYYMVLRDKKVSK